MFKIKEDKDAILGGAEVVLFAQRDPTAADTSHPGTWWFSTEYVPYRVFRGSAGVWKFVGKFYPLES